MKKAKCKSAQEFYDYFEAIPAERWITNFGAGPPSAHHCAMGFLGARDFQYAPSRPESDAWCIEKLFHKYLGVSVPNVNDASNGNSGYDWVVPSEVRPYVRELIRSWGSTPKARILHALKLIIGIQAAEKAERRARRLLKKDKRTVQEKFQDILKGLGLTEGAAKVLEEELVTV